MCVNFGSVATNFLMITGVACNAKGRPTDSTPGVPKCDLIKPVMVTLHAGRRIMGACACRWMDHLILPYPKAELVLQSRLKHTLTRPRILWSFGPMPPLPDEDTKHHDTDQRNPPNCSSNNSTHRRLVRLW